jgi:hypothetical protein
VAALSRLSATDTVADGEGAGVEVKRDADRGGVGGTPGGSATATGEGAEC